MKEFKINKYLSLRYTFPHTIIYIEDNYFMQCKRLILSIPKEDFKETEGINSIDEIAEGFDHTIHEHEIIREEGIPEVEEGSDFSLLSPEEEYWGHCSNLKAWAEHDYDTRLLKANLAFPLLKALGKAGDMRAKVRFKEEILKRISSGYEPVIEYLFVEGYIDYLSNEELLFGLLNPEEAEILLELHKNFNIEFKYVPNLERGIDFPPPINTEKVMRIRNFTMIDNFVKGLKLSNCGIVEIPESVSRLKRLKDLDLRTNPIELNSEHFVKVLEKLESLKRIYLWEDEVAKISPDILKRLMDKKIEILNLFSDN